MDSRENILNDKIKPYSSEEEKTTQLEKMFDQISDSYDRLNNLMTMWTAHSWRRSSIRSLKKYKPKQILDIAAGTGDMSVASCSILNPEKVMAVDISKHMMHIGAEKVKKKGICDKVSFEVQDCASLTYPNNSFDAVTIGFGLRNFEKLTDSLNEIHRVLIPGGKLLVLEANEPNQKWITKFYKCYINVFVFLTSWMISNDKDAYKYLTKSMSLFPQGKRLIEIFNKHGFKLIKHKKFTFGVAAMYLLETE